MSLISYMGPILGLMLVLACGDGGKKKGKGILRAPSASSEANPTGPSGDEPASDAPKTAEEVAQDSLALFSEHVYPLVKENCAGCHGAAIAPLFAQKDEQVSHDQIVDNAKVDFADVERSRLYLRLANENHNCWTECEADAALMLEKLNLWAEAYAGLEEQGFENLTESLAFASAVVGEVDETDPNNLVQLAAMPANLVAPMTVMDDDADGEVNQYIMVPAGNGGRIAPNDMGGEAVFNFELETAGTFTVWGRVNTADANSDSFHIKVDDGAFLRWNTGITNNEWSWVRSNNNGAELTFDLPAGPHTVTIKQREELAKINRVALTTTLENYAGGAIGVKEVQTLSFDLLALTGKNAKLLVSVEEFDAESKTILIKDPRIETDAPLTVKDVLPLVNGKAHPQHTNYRIVDTVVEPPGAVLSEAAMVLIGEEGFGADQLSFTFGVIE